MQSDGSVSEEAAMFEPVNMPRETYGKGENLLLCADAAEGHPLLDALSGQVQVVYIDPPFMTGDQFIRRRCFGTEGWRSGKPMPEYPAYCDRYESREAYLQMLRRMIEQANKLLQPSGVMYLHLDWRATAYARILCDEVFGEDMFLNEIIWSYESGGRAKKYFSRKHDTILLYARTKKYAFDLMRVPLPRTENRKNHMRRCVDEDGRAYSQIKSSGKIYRYYDDAPVYPGDVWSDIGFLQQRDPERMGYPTQKPLKLLERMLLPVVQKGDLVVDLCCGSGTTLEVAQSLGCRFVGVDKLPETILTAASRLNSGNLTMECPCTMDATALEGECKGAGSMLLLTGFAATHPCFPKTLQQLDTLESWAVGDSTEEGIRILQRFSRSRKIPDLPWLTVVPDNLHQLAVVTVDAACRKRVYQWKE